MHEHSTVDSTQYKSKDRNTLPPSAALVSTCNFTRRYSSVEQHEHIYRREYLISHEDKHLQSPCGRAMTPKLGTVPK